MAAIIHLPPTRHQAAAQAILLTALTTMPLEYLLPVMVTKILAAIQPIQLVVAHILIHRPVTMVWRQQTIQQILLSGQCREQDRLQQHQASVLRDFTGCRLLIIKLGGVWQTREPMCQAVLPQQDLILQI